MYVWSPPLLLRYNSLVVGVSLLISARHSVSCFSRSRANRVFRGLSDSKLLVLGCSIQEEAKGSLFLLNAWMVDAYLSQRRRTLAHCTFMVYNVILRMNEPSYLGAETRVLRSGGCFEKYDDDGEWKMIKIDVENVFTRNLVARGVPRGFFGVQSRFVLNAASCRPGPSLLPLALPLTQVIPNDAFCVLVAFSRSAR
jgi:hypothetical protein